LPPGNVNSAVAGAEVAIESAVLWLWGVAVGVSSLAVPKVVPVLLGGFQVELEGLLEVRVPLEVALGLVSGDLLSAVWVSSLEVSPPEPVLLSSLLQSLVVDWLDVIVSVQVALGHFFIKRWHAMLVSLFLMSKLLPVLLSLPN